jgi:hypothetical protein
MKQRSNMTTSFLNSGKEIIVFFRKSRYVSAHRTQIAPVYHFSFLGHITSAGTFHGQPFRWQCVPPLVRGSKLASLLSALFVLWKSFRNDADHYSDERPKLIGFKSE